MAKRGAETEGLYQLETAKAGTLEATQGGFPPWCMGSTFSPPQLIISDVFPLIFGQVDKPECIISTGQEIKFEEATTSETSEQTKSFLLSSTEPFVPSGLLQDYLEEDVALHKEDSDQKHLYRGNRLENVKCMDGNIVLFFPCGKIGERIGGSLCYPGSDGVWYPIRKSPGGGDSGDLDEPQLSVSPSFGQPILQLSSARTQPDVVDRREYIYIAARTLYQAHFCVVLREVKCIRFVATYAASFQTHVSHVTWNPHLDQEAAVLLKNGEVSLFDVSVGKNFHSNHIMDVKAKITLESPARLLRAKLTAVDDDAKLGYDDSVSALTVVVYEPREDQDAVNENLENETWWRCEFAWHPQILFVSGLHNVVKLDFRGELLSAFSAEGSACMKKKCFCELSVVAEVGVSNSLSRFCHTKLRKEQILAFVRTEYDGMCKFSVATEKHLMLFDARRVGAPVLQWEHGMQEDPPNLLLMLRASALESRLDEGKLKIYQNGRIIVAVSYRSGDMRLFFYGSKGARESFMQKSYSTGNDFEGYEWNDVAFAWEMPVKLTPPKTATSDWRDVLRMPAVQSTKKVHTSVEAEEVECISGIIISTHQLSERSASNMRRGFTVLQLTGLGDILLQQYKASDQSKVAPNVRTDSAFKAQEEKEMWETQKPRLLVLTAFFKYMRTGSTIAASDAGQGMLSGGVENGAICNNSSKVDGIFQNSTESVRSPGVEMEKFSEIRFRSQLKTVLHHLSVPLSMFEVAHTVLRMGLPPSWSPSIAGLPSDLESRRQKGHKLSSFLPLIYSGQTSDGAEEIEVELPDGCSVDRPEKSGREKKIIPGEKLFLEGCRNVENGFKDLKEKSVPAIISLSDPKEDWFKSELDNHTLRYEISMNIFDEPQSTDQSTAVDKAEKSASVAEPDEDVGSFFSRERLCTLVAGKPLTDQGKHEGNRLTIMEGEICPIKLSYTSRSVGGTEIPLEEQLEEQEWTALESLQAQLRNWQEKFKSYARFCKLCSLQTPDSFF
ncbi:hypothetical protein R1flu_005227 [Riccia fluitans]|uniref:Uncharacterized protein n=1 Tax=Riccia fluitans TaxID=41844 RepID=A0ABD1YSU7_9MARC